MSAIAGMVGNSNFSFADQKFDQSAGISGGFQNYGQLGDTGEVLFTSDLDMKNIVLYLGLSLLAFYFFKKKKKR